MRATKHMQHGVGHHTRMRTNAHAFPELRLASGVEEPAAYPARLRAAPFGRHPATIARSRTKTSATYSAAPWRPL